jgi:hypothetical protein
LKQESGSNRIHQARARDNTSRWQIQERGGRRILYGNRIQSPIETAADLSTRSAENITVGTIKAATREDAVEAPSGDVWDQGNQALVACIRDQDEFPEKECEALEERQERQDQEKKEQEEEMKREMIQSCKPTLRPPRRARDLLLEEKKW